MNEPSASRPSPPERHIEKAMLLMTVGMLIIPGIDAIAKWVSASISAGQVSWSRFVFQTLLMFPLFLRVPGMLFTPDIVIHVARGGLIALATLLFFAALKYLPMADALAIFFVEPLILTLLAAVFLGEKIGWRRLSAVAVGFGGALIVIRPNFQTFGWAAALPLGTALSFAVYLILTRQLAQREHPFRMQFYSGLFGGIIMTLALAVGTASNTPVLIFVWPTAFEWFLLAALGVIGATAHLFVVYAFQRAPAVLLAPFQYIEIIGATILGLIVFGDFPDVLSWCGVAVIVSSGLYVFYRERTVGRQGRR